MENNIPNLPFRPLDSSESTSTKYRLEAEHWNKAFTDSQRRYKSGDAFNNMNSRTFSGLGVIPIFGGLLIALIGLIELIFLLMYDFIRTYMMNKRESDRDKAMYKFFDDQIASMPDIEGETDSKFYEEK